MSTDTDIGDLATRTSFEISKTGWSNWWQSDGFAALELICEDPTSMDWQTFLEAIPTLWTIEWPPEDKVRSLYNYITNYAVAPRLTTCTDFLIEETMKCKPFIEVGTLYKTEHYGFRCDSDFRNTYKSALRGSSIVDGVRVPGYLMSDKQTFAPLNDELPHIKAVEFSEDLAVFVAVTREGK